MDLSIIIFIAAVLNFSLGIFIWRSNKTSVTHRTFALMAILIGSWVFLNYILQLVPSLWLFKLILLVGPFLIVSTMSWIGSLKEQEQPASLKLWQSGLVVISSIAAILIILSSNIIVSITTPTSVNLGSSFVYYAIFLGLLLAFLTTQIITTFYTADRKLKNRFRYAGIGLVIFIILVAVFDIVLPIFHITALSMLDSPSSLIFVLFTAYSIVSQHLFEIKLLTAEFLITSIILILVSELIFADSKSEKLASLFAAIPAGYLGYLLFRSLKTEAAQRAQLEKDKEELVELDRMKDEFLQMATHELNTPIAVIKGRLDMAINENISHLNPEQKKLLLPVLEDTNRLARLSKDILDTARIDQKRLKLNQSEVDLDSLISTIVSDLQPKAAERRNELTFQASMPAIPKLEIDQSKITEVITNLLTNALKFTDHGRVTISTKIEGENVVVAVADTGVGIDEQDQKHLFQKFYQAGRFDPKAPQEQQGTGLGLYISKSIINLHGGEMRVKSAKGHGTTFSFTLPLKTTHKMDTQPALTPAAQSVT